MPDIAKINAVAIADIEKLDSILAANIEKVNGLVFSTAPAFVGLLDTYTGAAAGYSTRRLSSSATNLMRIREDSGDTETDIGYDSNNELDTAAIATHCGTANGFVVKWYDQSGNGNDAYQPTAGFSGLQPKIYDGTSQAVITENGKPAVDFDGSNHYMITTSTITVNSTRSDFGVFALNRNTGNGGALCSTDSIDGGPRLAQNLRTTTTTAPTLQTALTVGFPVKVVAGTTSLNTSTQYLMTATQSTSTLTLYLDGTSENSASHTNNTGSSKIGLGVGSGVSGKLEGVLQEIVMYNSDQDAAGNRTGIEGNVNAHFQIGNFGTPTSGLLFDYPDAAAAYSVRQLANTAALSMRVREDATDTETNIGFDANGDLDTAAIAAHCGTANGYVVTWYDQSGNGNDAEQPTSGGSALQPQIYNGTAVITRNGKPLIESTENVTSFNVVSLSQSAPYTMMGVSYNHNDFNRAIAFGNIANMRAVAARNKAQFQSTSGSVITASVNLGDSSVVYTAVANGTNSFVRALGETASAETSGATTDTALTELQPGASGTGVSSMQELILWDGALSSTDYGAIETDMDTFFSVT